MNLEGDYEGTWADCRLNPPMRVFDLFGENTRAALGEVILAWNLVDDQGEPVALEPTLLGATDEELTLLTNGYLAVLRGKTELPKENETPSGTTSLTST